jgi:hypothetical protein
MLPLYNQIKPIIINSNKVINNINKYAPNLNQNKKTIKEISNTQQNNQINNNLPTFFQ